MPEGEYKNQVEIPHDAPWVKNLQHRPDPNRVTQADIPAYGQPEMRTPEGAAVPSDQGTAHVRPLTGFAHDAQPDPSYYNVSPLKPPLWHWEIAWYFFLGGASSGAYLISRMAERFGGRRFKDVAKIGSYVALGTFLPCPPLLIIDLGDPKRFHHMLRVFKPSSPMSLGTWAITAYSGAAVTQAARQFLSDPDADLRHKSTLSKLTGGMLLLATDAVGVPTALVVAGYTGVLLSCTANPLWGRSKWLGPLFSAGAISSGASAISLFLPSDSESHDVLEKVDTAAHIVEAVCMAGFLKERGPLAKPLTQGNQAKNLKLATATMIGSEALKFLPLPGKLRRFAGHLAAILALISGFFLRWSMVYGGREAANDAKLSRESMRPPQSQARI
jgi:formate-dependent nitrite reductase membrane component NrfD